MKIKSLTTIVFTLLFVLTSITPVYAQEEMLEGKIIKLLEKKIVVLITKGSLKDKEIMVEAGSVPIVGQAKYKKGDEILISYSKDFEGNDSFYITDFIRRNSLIWLFFIFVVLAIAVGRWRGLSSLLGMGLSFLVIFKFILPHIYEGRDPVFIAITGALFIIPLTFYLSHGFNKKTTVAMMGTFAALVITGLLAKIFVETAKLTGFASEEAGFLQVAKQGVINIKGLLLAGIIIGALGVLDDVTVSQSAIVFQLKQTNTKIKSGELYRRAMDVGKDHIASMVNTLILVYTGAALPLLLLFIDNPHPFSEVINYEIIADEIVRTLVGSIGLVLAVPITTLIASLAVGKKY